MATRPSEWQSINNYKVSMVNENDLSRSQGLQIRVRNLKAFLFYLSTKTFVVDTQKNRLNETVLLSIQNICYN